MISPGVCSVTFRSLGVTEVIDLAVRAGLAAIEWGADVHVPPGDAAGATRVARQCADAGLACPSYGSYLFAGRDALADAGPVLDTAAALGVDTVRVWAPNGSTAEELVALVDTAADRSLTLSLEFHPGTRTETATSTLELLDAVPGLGTYWQPEPGADPEASRREYDAVAGRCTNLHVFWWRAVEDRRPLAEGEDLWPGVLADAGGRAGDRFAYLEFVGDDDAGQFVRDAATLRGWVA